MEQLNHIIGWLKGFAWAGNTGYDYAVALLIFASLLIVLKLFQLVILGRLRVLAKKTRTDFDDLAIEIFNRIKPPLYLLVALYFGIKAIEILPPVDQIINILLVVAIAYEIIRALEKLIDYFAAHQLDKVESSDGWQSQAMVRALRVIVKFALWLFGLALILSNLGIDITSLIAGLGIGGIAVALAIQNILEDLFSSFSIYLDKTFSIGDFIVAGESKGTVEKIGLKSTRLRSLNGEELIISNRELTSARIQNYKRMDKRRDSFSLGVVYGTGEDKLEKIPSLVKEIIFKVKEAEFDRCHFTAYGDFSLNFDIVYFVKTTDYNEFLDIKQKINLEIYKKFKEEKIDFAYPTQTVFLGK